MTKRAQTTGWLMLGLLVAADSCTNETGTVVAEQTHAQQPALPSTGEVNKMTAADIVLLIRQKDWSFTEEETVQIDPAAAAALIELCKDPDPETRELTLYALNAIPGLQPRSCLLQALHDEDINVRSVASRFALTNPQRTDMAALHRELVDNDDELVRESVALALGKIGDQSSDRQIEDRLATEQDPAAKHAMHLALVRLHNEAHRERYASMLQALDPRERVKTLQDYIYVADRAFLPQIANLMFDEQPGLDIGPSNAKILIRVCDVAVNVLDEVLAHPFAFDVAEGKKYSPEERVQAAELVRGLR